MFLKAEYRIRGFTLIEMSIVLVIIGLIVGGILVGRDLITASEVRAQITQIEKYNSAVNTFRSKFNYLPGDMRPEAAQQFGFTVGGGCSGNLPGFRDGNGLIDGGLSVGVAYPLRQNIGEPALFWQDISSSAAGNLIDGVFPNSGGSVPACNNTYGAISTMLEEYYPTAKIGHSNFIYVYDDGTANWFGVSAVTALSASNGTLSSNANIPVTQAYKIDLKTDDGLPKSGNVQANYINGSNVTLQSAPNSTTAGGTSSSCYDTTTGTYSVTVNNGSGDNCALSFKFQ